MSDTSERPLKLETEQQGSTVVVRVCGSVSIGDAESLRDRLAEFTASKVPLIVLDLSEMDFICSTGLGAIILAHVRARRYEGQVRLVAPQPIVRKLLETTRLTKLFQIFSSIPQATAP